MQTECRRKLQTCCRQGSTAWEKNDHGRGLCDGSRRWSWSSPDTQCCPMATPSDPFQNMTRVDESRCMTAGPAGQELRRAQAIFLGRMGPIIQRCTPITQGCAGSGINRPAIGTRTLVATGSEDAPQESARLPGLGPNNPNGNASAMPKAPISDYLSRPTYIKEPTASSALPHSYPLYLHPPSHTFFPLSKWCVLFSQYMSCLTVHLTYPSPGQSRDQRVRTDRYSLSVRMCG